MNIEWKKHLSLSLGTVKHKEESGIAQTSPGQSEISRAQWPVNKHPSALQWD